MSDIFDKVWKYIFSLFDFISDNAWLTVLICTVIISLVTAAFIIKNIYPVFGPVEWIYCIVLSRAIERLPYIHERLNLAINTSVNIIKNYPSYTEQYIEMTGDTGLKQPVTYIFHNLTESSDFFWSHLYQTVGDICHVSILGYIQEPLSVVLVIIVSLLVILACYRSGKKKIFFHIIQCAVLLYLGITNRGSYFAALFLIVAGGLFSLFSDIDEDKEDTYEDQIPLEG